MWIWSEERQSKIDPIEGGKKGSGCKMQHGKSGFEMESGGGSQALGSVQGSFGLGCYGAGESGCFPLRCSIRLASAHCLISADMRMLMKLRHSRARASERHWRAKQTHTLAFLMYLLWAALKNSYMEHYPTLARWICWGQNELFGQFTAKVL